MSIYASLPAPDDLRHEDCCTKWREVEPGVFESVEGAPCTCGLPRAPIVYRGSHVLPSAASDPRGGSVDLALIPGHITRNGRDDGPDDGAPWPYLRLGVNGETVVLDRAGVALVHRTLSRWLDDTDGEG